MKILQMLLSPSVGGAEKSFVDLCNALAETQDIRVVILRGAGYRSLLNPTIPVHELGSNALRYNPFLHAEIAAIVRREKPDIVHTHSAKATEVFHRLNRLFGLPHVASKRNARKGRIFNRLPHVIAVSKDAARSIQGTGVTIIYNGIAPLPHTPVTGKAEDKPKAFRITAAGRLDPIKGFDRLIQAAARLNFDYHLTIYGDGPEHERLKRLIRKLGLEQRVSLAGFTGRLDEIMRDTSLVVISSLSEGFSRVLVEGLHYAPVVLSTRVGSADQILTEPFLVDAGELAERITQVHDDYPQYASAFDLLRHRHADRFTLQNVEKQHIDYYRSLL